MYFKRNVITYQRDYNKNGFLMISKNQKAIDISKSWESYIKVHFKEVFHKITNVSKIPISKRNYLNNLFLSHILFAFYYGNPCNIYGDYSKKNAEDMQNIKDYLIVYLSHPSVLYIINLAISDTKKSSAEKKLIEIIQLSIEKQKQKYKNELDLDKCWTSEMIFNSINFDELKASNINRVEFLSRILYQKIFEKYKYFPIKEAIFEVNSDLNILDPEYVKTYQNKLASGLRKYYDDRI